MWPSEGASFGRFFSGLWKGSAAHPGLQRYFFVVTICHAFTQSYGSCPTSLQVTCPCLLRSSCANLFMYHLFSFMLLLPRKNFISVFKSCISWDTHWFWFLSHKRFNWVASFIVVPISCPRTTTSNNSLSLRAVLLVQREKELDLGKQDVRDECCATTCWLL